MLKISLASAKWQFRDATKRSPWKSAVVPGCVHRDLLRHGAIPDPFWGANELELQWIEEHDWEYRTSFRVDSELLDEARIELVADGLDTIATVRLNGAEVGRTENMFIGHRWDIKRRLRRGENKLSIRFDSAMRYIRTHRLDHHPREFNDPVGRSQVIRKQQCQFGWDWGPRFVTAGVWRDIRLEAWSGLRLESVRVTQEHRRDGTVKLTLAPELTDSVAAVVPTATARHRRRNDGRHPNSARSHAWQHTIRWRLEFERGLVAEGTGTEIIVAQPQLWWPNGHGAQPLYDLQVSVGDASGHNMGEWHRRIGLRTIVLDRHTDRWGESFQFRINGRPIFAKGANWIPAHSFVAGLKRDDYARDLHGAAAAHMNMVRVWGGGIYESEDFYDLCDQLGLLVWQDFMFACAIYPGDRAFVASVAVEAEQQIRRLRHRACLALWCGNNEIEQLNAELLQQPKLRRNYDAIFHRLLPDAVARWDAVTPYWPSSQFRGDGDNTHAAGEKRGDSHFWDVWHARHPIKDYEKWKFRFVSEFGMQSFSSPATQATFCPSDDANVFGPTMKEHQKNRAGNQIILDYVSQLYRFPNGQDSLIYLSQLNQALCMQRGVEHWRRNMPRCMGALYWQLNDCWPVTSWSSIEFTGRWKVLHHVARRFFAPALVSAHVPGDESVIIGNYRRSTIREVHLHTVYDAPQSAPGTLSWTLYHLDGRILLHGEKRVVLRYGESVRQKTLDLAKPIAEHTHDRLFLRIALEIEGRRVSEESVFLTSPRFLALPKATKTAIKVRLNGPQAATLVFTSPVFQHRFEFDLPGTAFRSSDNFFELYPGESKTIAIELEKPTTATRLRKSIVHRSLADTY